MGSLRGCGWYEDTGDKNGKGMKKRIQYKTEINIPKGNNHMKKSNHILFLCSRYSMCQ